MQGKVSFRSLARLLASLILLMTWHFFAPAICQGQTLTSKQLLSRVGPDEFDTEANRGGQIGGRLFGFGYKLLAMRCVTGQVIVGARVRRGDVLDYLQIVCAAPTCTGKSCSWSSSAYGMSAGNPAGGDAHPLMMCQTNEIVSGIRGRVVSFTVPVVGQRTGFDYAADIEIECSTMTAAAVSGPSGQRFYPITQGGSGTWHHPEGGFTSAAPGIARNVVQSSITAPISCRGRGYGASAVSVGISNFLGSSERPVVQAASLFCARIPPQPVPDPTCPTSLTVADVQNVSKSVQQQWFAPSAFSAGGRTAGGSLATMEAEPTSGNFQGKQISELVSLDTTVAQCQVPNPAALCTVGTGLLFTIGNPNKRVSPNGTVVVTWAPPAGQTNGRFVDQHFALDPRNTPEDYLARLPVLPAGGCTVTCTQTYSCGTGNTAVTYGPFQIFYSLTHGTWTNTFASFPTGAGRSVTLVNVDKR